MIPKMLLNFILIIFNLLFIVQPIFSDLDLVDTQILQTTEAFYTRLWLNKSSNSNHLEVMASLSGHADLPSWMHYFRRPNSSIGYLYGTAPKDEDGDLDVDIIILNNFNYNVTSDRIKYRIINREAIYKYQVEIKFFEMDLQDFFERQLSRTVQDIFQNKLWNNKKLNKIHNGEELVKSGQSTTASPVYLTKIARPIDVGGRFPLDPKEKECVVVRVGSIHNFTDDLIRLENEVIQIKNRDPCPKRYKASMVEYIFRERRLYVDWCSFKLIRPDSN